MPRDKSLVGDGRIRIRPSAFTVTRTDAEINKMLNVCNEWEEHGGSQLRGRTYEQGIADGLGWLRGDNDLTIAPPDMLPGGEDEDDLDDDEDEDGSGDDYQ